MDWSDELFMCSREDNFGFIIQGAKQRGDYILNVHSGELVNNLSREYIHYFISYAAYRHIPYDEETISIHRFRISLALFMFCWWRRNRLHNALRLWCGHVKVIFNGNDEPRRIWINYHRSILGIHDIYPLKHNTTKPHMHILCDILQVIIARCIGF